MISAALRPKYLRLICMAFPDDDLAIYALWAGWLRYFFVCETPLGYQINPENYTSQNQD
jgi:hypothetical protein